MRYLFSLLMFLLFIGWADFSLGQSVNFEDGFEDGDFTDNPAWFGDTDQFVVVDGDPNHLLQLQGDDENGDVSYLSTESNDVEGSWEFYINLNYSPSNSNRVDIFLISDIANLEGDVNGYAIRAGENGSDDVFRLVRYENGSEVETVLSGTTDISSGGPFRVKIIRQAGGNWTLEVGQGYDGPLSVEGTEMNNNFSTAFYTGIRATYTSTRDDLFTFDFKIDLPPFAITETTAQGNQVDITFNRPYDKNTVVNESFSVDGLGGPSTISYTDKTTITLNYDKPIPSGEYILSVSDIDDVQGETIGDNTTSSFVIFAEYNDGDILINEFAYDYPPALGEEYIELKNTSDKYLNLADWQIADNNSSTSLGSDPIPIEPDSFLVISADTTELYNLFGNRAYYETSFPALNNTTPDAVQIFTDDGSLADSLTYAPDWGGTDVALERRSATAPSTFQENWGDSPNANGGTPGVANEVSADNTPPQLTGLNIISAQTLQLTFDERLDEIGNYELTNGSISSAKQTAPEIVELSLGSDLQNTQIYTLSIENFRDIFDNTSSSDTSFIFYEPSPADSGDVVINEFMYAPPAESSEYIELYNHSDKSLDLKGWSLSDNRESFEATITSESFIVPPDSFVVLAPDNTLETHFPDVTLITTSNFPALNNGGDAIVIRSNENTLLDSLSYTSAWGGDEIALERRTTSLPAVYLGNWGDAPNGFGTPGKANEISVDENPPVFEDLWAEDATTLKLLFSEHIGTSAATDSRNYRIWPHKDIQLISVREDTVTLFLSEEIESGESYEVTVSNISDIFGNTMSEASLSTDFLRIDQARPGDIVINEIMYKPGTGDADFVELYNVSNKNFDLQNWKINDASGGATISSSMQFKSGEFLVLTGSQPFARQAENAHAVERFPSLNNNIPDDIYLKTQDGRTIDSLRYEQSWGGNIEGSSLERKDPRGASNDPSNWQTSEAENGYSAGTQNVSFQEDSDPPELIFSKISSEGNIEVHFSEFIKLTDDLQFLAGDQPLEVIEFDSTRANIVALSTGAAKGHTENNSIIVQNLSDVKGNVTSTSEVPISQPLASSDLVINEIMFNPLAEPDDNRPDQSEYIELRNTRDYAISLEGLVLHDEPDENGEVRELIPVSTTAKWVSPQGQVLVHADGASEFEDSHIATFFELESPNMQSILRVDRSTLSLASTGDAIFIADSSGATIDSVFYSEEWHNPNIIDTRGISLERITPDGPSNKDSNWGSSVSEKGGTPNSENSIYQENASLPQETGISFTPNPFSPDSDGHEDNLFINYKLDHQDYLIDVRVYDRYGRLIRELADGQQAGFEGQLIWDGRKDDNSRNRIGIYIVVFEAYDSTSGADQTFKETVVLARMLN